jgi:hypothetical protein
VRIGKIFNCAGPGLTGVTDFTSFFFATGADFFAIFFGATFLATLFFATFFTGADFFAFAVFFALATFLAFAAPFLAGLAGFFFADFAIKQSFVEVLKKVAQKYGTNYETKNLLITSFLGA